MRCRSFIIHSFMVWCLCAFAYGQNYNKMDDVVDDYKVFGKNNISLSMVPLIQSGFEVSYDRKIVNKHWIKVSPVFYRKQDYTRSDPDDLKLLQGYGFKVHHKYFPYNNTVSRLGVFIDYGPNFTRFDITTKALKTAQFDKYGLECVIGFHKVLANVFYYEFYAGLATNIFKPLNDESGSWRDVMQNRSQLWFDYGVTGNYFLLGINLGVLF